MTPGFSVLVPRKDFDPSKVKAGDDCPHCNEAKLRNLDSSSLVCPSCYSAFSVGDPKDPGIDAGIVISWIVCGVVTLLICVLGLSVIYSILNGEG